MRKQVIHRDKKIELQQKRDEKRKAEAKKALLEQQSVSRATTKEMQTLIPSKHQKNKEKNAELDQVIETI